MKDFSANPNTSSLSLDEYGDPSRIMKVFNQFILVIILGFGAGIVFELSNNDFFAAVLLGICLVPVLASLYFIRCNKFEVAATFLAIVLISLVTAVATNGEGIHRISVLAYPAVLIVASLVIRKWIMALLTLYNIACAAWLIFGEITGAYTPVPLLQPTPWDFLIITLILASTAFMVRLLTEALFQNNLRLQKELQERKVVEQHREALITELEARNDELVQFTYMISHDLKSPLVTIKGFLGFLEADVKNGKLERMKDDMGRIANAVDKMQRLLNDLLELSRIGRLMNPSEEVAFEEIIREARELLHGHMSDRAITFKLTPNLPIVFGDKQRLVEVLQNLIDNAIKFMGDQKNPKIEIGQQGEDAERGNLIFYVKDNGIGIAPEYHELVFGLFNRLALDIDGTGIGLALVKRIVEFHGGRIWVESKTGKGSTFYFSLPKPI